MTLRRKPVPDDRKPANYVGAYLERGGAMNRIAQQAMSRRRRNGLDLRALFTAIDPMAPGTFDNETFPLMRRRGEAGGER